MELPFLKKTPLQAILNDLIKVSFRMDYEHRFDAASLKNNVHNVKVTGEIRYLDDFFTPFQSERFLLAFDEAKKMEGSSISAYENAEELKKAIYALAIEAHEAWAKKRKKPLSEKALARALKPVISYEKVNIITAFRRENRNKGTFKMLLLGNQERRGIVLTAAIYILLVLFGFVFFYPILYMIAYSFMSLSDLADPNVNYLPTALNWENFSEAWHVMDYSKTLAQTLMISVLPAICQTAVCALTGWGLARLKFKGSKVVFGLILFTFLLPSCLTMLPEVAFYARLGITGTPLAYILPALFGQGLKSAVFILIFYQYFKAIPQAVIEAAEIDGANTFVIFFRIGLASAKSAVLLTVLLSIVWYYNETVLASVFFGSAITTLPLQIENFKTSFDSLYQGTPDSGKSVNEAIYMAGTILNILPLVVLYAFTQKFFIQGMDKAGITGE